MGNAKTATEIEVMVQPIIDKLNLELVDVEFVKEGAQWYLRVFIDKDGGVEIDDCQAVSVELDSLLEEKDLILQSYILEVSSPGIERPLKKPADFEKYAGNSVLVKTFAPINGEKHFNGNLIGLKENFLHIEIDGEVLTIPFEKVASTRLTVEF